MNGIAFVVFVGGALALFFAFRLVDMQRTSAIRAMATRLGFHYLGEALPRSLMLEGTPFDIASRVWNVIDGEPRGARIIAFDCQIGVGKSSWSRTVIVVENTPDLSLLLNPEMTIDSVGPLKVLYQPRTMGMVRRVLMPLEELESYLSSIAADTSRGQ